MGVVVDIGGTLVGAFLVVIGATVVLAAQGLQFEEIEASVTRPETGSLFFNLFLVMGLGFSLLGGYVCARISRVKIYRQGLILSGIICSVGFLAGLAQYPIGLNLSMSAATAAAIFLGVWLFARKNKPGGA